MRLSRAPDLGAARLMTAAAMVVTLVAIAILSVRDGSTLSYGLGDTDDATRLVLVRDFLANGQWYDQLVERLQPPLGLQMHWSRLIDGGIAGLITVFDLFTSPAQAEYAARFVWPMLWILPAVVGSLLVARRLGGGAAILAGSILMLTELSLFIQFRPGRIDHHGPQIALFMLTLGGAATESLLGATVAGVATGLGLAVGLESMIFAIAVGVFFPLAYLFGADGDGRRMARYGLAIALTTAGAFLIQTPPWRWSVVACDAVGANLVVAVFVAGAGLVAASRMVGRRDWRWRLGALVAVGAVAAATYIALDPRCLAGPFADVDPRLKDFWLAWVQEIRPVTKIWGRGRSAVYELMAPCVAGPIAWLWLARDRSRLVQPVFILAGVCLVLACIAGFSAIRMATYANWIAIPIIAAAVTDAVERYAKGTMLVLVLATVAATPIFGARLVTAIDKQFTPKPSAAPKPVVKPAPKAASAPVARAPAAPSGVRGDRCFHAAAYNEFAKLPAGLTLSEVDLGPFILAYTPSAAMAAPYHRMNWGLLTARRVLSTEAEAAQVEFRKLGFRYVLECPTHTRNGDRVGMAAGSLQKRLDANQPPSWLELVPTTGALRLYKVRTAVQASTAPREGGA